MASRSGESDSTAVEEKELDGNTSGNTNGHTAAVEEAASSYPELTVEADQMHDTQGWRAGGIRFAPLQVPLMRRLQTAAVLYHCMTVGLLLGLFFFLCGNPLLWVFVIPYLLNLSFSTAATDGKVQNRSEWLRSLPIWTFFAAYFPMRLHKTHELAPTRKYIFGYHPHGIISHGAFASFATNALGFAEKFPGITNSVLTLDSNFRTPLYRDYLLALGLRSVSKDSIWNILTKGGRDKKGMGNAATIVIGGARESLEAQPGTLRLLVNGRKGFVKMALKTGADLVPVLAFGENDLYDQLSPETHPGVHKFQMLVLKIFKFTLPAIHGRGVLNYDVGLMPYRRSVNVVVGRPIEVQRTLTPSQEDIDQLHEKYVTEVRKIWDTYKDVFSPDRKAEMEFCS